MVLASSTTTPLGTPAPDFALPDTDGRIVRRDDFRDKPLLVMFICNHCPYVKHVAPALADVGREYAGRGVAIVAIGSNDAATYPDDAPDKMVEEKRLRGYTFPYLHDPTQDVARAYRAECTPDVFLFDAQHRLYYRGEIDDTRPNRNGPGDYTSPVRATGASLRAALDALLEGKPAPQPQHPSRGCSIKWRAAE